MRQRGNIMQAIILAAGRGSRLKQSNKENPKALIQLDQTHLVEYQISILRYFGVNDICIVVGYEGEIIRSVVGDQCHYIENTKYADTNSLYSLWLARNWVNDDLIVINSDVLAHPNIFWHLAGNSGNTLVYDSTSDVDDESMKVELAGDKLRRISKSFAVIENSKGESLGILKFKAAETTLLFREVEEALKTGGVNQWAPAAFDGFARENTITCIDIAGLPWVEIDYVEDLDNAKEKVWPKIRQAITAPPYNQVFELPILTYQRQLSGGSHVIYR